MVPIWGSQRSAFTPLWELTRGEHKSSSHFGLSSSADLPWSLNKVGTLWAHLWSSLAPYQSASGCQWMMALSWGRFGQYRAPRRQIPGAGRWGRQAWPQSGARALSQIHDRNIGSCSLQFHLIINVKMFQDKCLEYQMVDVYSIVIQ